MTSFIRLVLAAEQVRRKGDWITVGNEIQYFWRRGVRVFIHPCHWIYGGEWLIEDIPDPTPWFGNDPIRYVFATCIAEQMAEVYNWRLDRLNVRRDRWVGKVSGQWNPRLPPLGVSVPRDGVQMSDHLPNVVSSMSIAKPLIFDGQRMNIRRFFQNGTSSPRRDFWNSRGNDIHKRRFS
ncbi:uncharacterized protein BT62DRAFT_61830 [Guyanagaster necrorhizus]|uniref:Uncharacterized protein n=1 Tax=Guyanagaster necrorhizus TaxID=856835 RepID=A0A9P8AT61_9AGAR|nr:uncharacterized protein BT62DRAFT_61830 [Guyanagaster necrorhizus MCA 3950]KAG7447108.1 hypothetical protein BT62DRAFT_61830 [Guyanagaster necrorhizus MCA 3950]